MVGVVSLAGCSTADDAATTPVESRSTASVSSPATGAPTDYTALTDAIAPLAEPLGWEVQRAYRQSANFIGNDVDLVNVYLRPIGDDPPPEEYVADAMVALRTIAADVFANEAGVSAIDVCLQRPNDASPAVDVEPAVRILGLRTDIEPLLGADVQLVDLLRLSRQRRLVLVLDDYVQRAPAWAEALADPRASVPSG
jgi:hypothetical protein